MIQPTSFRLDKIKIIFCIVMTCELIFLCATFNLIYFPLRNVFSSLNYLQKDEKTCITVLVEKNMRTNMEDECKVCKKSFNIT